MTKNEAETVNRELYKIVTYINHVAEAKDNYEKGLEQLCQQNRISTKKIVKTKRLKDFEDLMIVNYQKARSYYDKIKEIRDYYEFFGEAEGQLADYKYDLEHTLFRKFLRIQLQLIKTNKIKNKLPDDIEAVVDIVPEQKIKIKKEEEIKSGEQKPKSQKEEQKKKAEEFAKQKTTQQAQQNSTSQSSSENWIMPCTGKIVGKYLEPRPTHIHNGIDISVPIGTPVKAIADGTVYYAGSNDPNGYGTYIILTHIINGKIITSEYGHLSSFSVKKDQFVKQGEIIGYSGNTGHSNGPHCHLTIREGVYKGKHVNPYKYIKH